MKTTRMVWKKPCAEKNMGWPTGREKFEYLGGRGGGGGRKNGTPALSALRTVLVGGRLARV